MAVGGERVQLHGLREFVAALRRMDSTLPRAVRLAGNRAANIVVTEARPRVPIGPPQGGHALMSIKAASTRTASRVRGGGNRYPYYPWLDFGGRVGRNNSVVRPFRRRGRYIWPAFVDKRQQVLDEMLEALTDVAESAGVDVS